MVMPALPRPPMPGMPMPQPAALSPLPPPPMPSPLGMMGGPLPLPMQTAGIDPMLGGLADPNVLMLVLAMMEQMQEAQNGPVYESWYKPGDYPMPSAEMVEEKARRDQELYSLLTARIRADRRLLLLLDVGRFHDFDPDVEHTFQDSALAHDFMLQVNLVAGCDINYNAIARTKEEEAIAEKKELFAQGMREHNLRRHARMYGTILAYDEAKYLAGTGRLVSRIMYDLDAPSDECPIKVDLLDPATCFPTWDGDRGLATMTRVYTETADRVIATWDTKKHKVRKTILDAYVPDGKGGKRKRTLNDTVQVHEYWDRRNHKVTVDGQTVLEWEHKFGMVPFVYTMTPFGDSGPTSLDALLGVTAPGAISSQVKAEVAMKGLSVIWASKTTHTQREALLGLMMTEINKVRNPPRTFEQDMMIYGQSPQVADAPGSVSLLRKGLENEVDGPKKPGMSLIPAVMNSVNEANQRGLMPPSAYGLSANANESGTAFEGLNESGRDKITPLLEALTLHHIQVAEWGLRLVRDWGHLLGSDGQRGTLYVARTRPKPGQGGYVTIEPSELRQVGIKIKARLTSIRLSNLGNMANALGVLKSNGWIEDVTAMELLGLVDDPVASLERIEVQEIQKSDEYRKWRAIKRLRNAGDFEGAEFIASLTASANSQIPVGQGMPPGMPPGAPGGPGTMGGNTPGANGPMTPPLPGALGGVPGQMPPGPGMGPRTDVPPPGMG